jgi:hypothetical protein
MVFVVFSSILFNAGVNTTRGGAIGVGVVCVWPVVLIPIWVHAGGVCLIGGVSIRRFGGEIVGEVIPCGVVVGFDFPRGVRGPWAARISSVFDVIDSISSLWRLYFDTVGIFRNSRCF